MLVLVCGSRRYSDRPFLWAVLTGLWIRHDNGWIAGEHREPLVVMHGACPSGADAFADEWVLDCEDHGPYLGTPYDGGRGVDVVSHAAHAPVDVVRIPADWDGPCDPDSELCQEGHRRQRRDGSGYCPTAGFRRNQVMANQTPDLVLAFTQQPVVESRGTWDMVRRATTGGLQVQVLEDVAPMAVRGWRGLFE